MSTPQSSMPTPLRTSSPPGGNGNPSHDAIITQQNMYNTHAKLINPTGGKGKRMNKRMNKRGGAGIVVNTITERYTGTMAGNQAPGNQQLNGLQTINQSQVQSQSDQVPLITPSKGGKKSKKSRKSRKSRKTKKSRKSRKSRKSKK